MIDRNGILSSGNAGFVEPRNGASPELVELLSSAQDFLTTTVADSTKDVYSRDWRDFSKWCIEHDLPHLPSNPEVAACYFTSLALKGIRVTTIRRHSAAIAAAHRESGYPSPTSHPAIKELLRGMTRKLGTPPKPVDALLSADIRKIVRLLPDTLIGIRDKALILVGYAGAFRRSELVGINIEDVSYREEGLVILLRRTKTDQCGEGRWVGIPYGKNPETCPLAALRRWLEISGLRDGAIFRGLDRHGNLAPGRLSSRSVAVIIKRAASVAGLDATKVSGHSLRSGHVTQAVRSGVAEHVIRQQTGHTNSASLKFYIRRALIFEENSEKCLLPRTLKS